MKTLNDLMAKIRMKPSDLTSARKQGLKIVGYTPGGYFPEELAYACGVVPVALLRGGDHESVTAAGPYLARFLDTFCRSQISYRILGEEPLYQMVDLIAAMVTDNHIRAIAESWEYWTDVDTFKVAVPANKTEHGREYFLEGLYRLRDKFETISENKFSESKLKEEIILFNKMRDILSQISYLRKEDSPPLTGKEFMALNQASFFVNRHIMVDALETIQLEIMKRDTVQKQGPRLMMIGSTLAMGDTRIVDLIEETGASIVFEDFTEGMRPYSLKVDMKEDLMKELATAYFMRRLPGAYAKPAIKDRFAYFFEKAEEFKVDGIIWYSLLYRDIYDMEGFLFEQLARKKKIPILKINSDYDYGEKEPLRTRIETFTEMI